MADKSATKLVPDSVRHSLRWAVIALLVLVCLPLVLLTYSYHATGQFQTDDAILKTFAGFAGTSDDSLAQIHRALLAMMGAFAPLAFRDPSSARWANAMIAILLLGVALSIYLSGVFNSPPVRAALAPYRLFGPTNPAATQQQVNAAFDAGMGQFKAFFARTLDTLIMYLLLLLGLKAEQAAK